MVNGLGRFFWLGLVLLLTHTAQARSYRYPVTGWNFDWDDNIFYMPTQIRLWTSSGEEIGVSTADYALIREKIGVEAPWDRHEFRTDLATGSLRFFGDEGSRENIFLKDVLQAMASHRDQWQGPSWPAFVRATSNPATARNISIITARMHSPRTIYAALKELQRRGFIRHLPLQRNIFPVGYPKIDPRFSGSSGSPSAAKAVVMAHLLDQFDRLPLAGRPPVENREGTGRAALHLWGFSDDDYGNYSKAADFLSKEVARGRWKNMKISLYFTGKNHPTIGPRLEVIQSDGSLRRIGPNCPQDVLRAVGER